MYVTRKTNEVFDGQTEKMTHCAAPAFSPPLPHTSQEHRYPQSTGLFPILEKTLQNQFFFCQIDVLLTVILNFFVCLLVPA